MMSGPVAVDVEFLLPRPASAPKSRVWPDRRPDLDKLPRSIFDALATGGAIADDAQVVEIVGRKRYAETWTGARVTISPMKPISRLGRRGQIDVRPVADAARIVPRRHGPKYGPGYASKLRGTAVTDL